MKAIGIGLAAVLIVVSAASSAFAAKSDIPPEARKAGMAAAPAVIAAGKVPCTLTDARLLGEASDGSKQKVYEVACQDSLGYVIAAKPNDPSPTLLDCVMVSGNDDKGKPNPMACKLPGNANPGAGLASAVASSGRTCW